MENIAIKVKSLTKTYKLYNRPIDRLKESISLFGKKYHKEFYALNNISFEVPKGQTLGIIGKNGSGKSTLLKVITGVVTPSYGNIVVNGKVSALLELGAGFNPEMTGMENIFLNGAIMGYTKDEIQGKLQSILEFADIGDFINQPVKMYSSGMFVRLAFAVAISVEPDILIIDEALAVGDVFFQQKCNIFMREKLKNVTKIIVSHDLITLGNFADRVIVLDSGSIAYEGDCLSGIEHYTKIIHCSLKTDSVSEKISNSLYDEFTEDIEKADILWQIIDDNKVGGMLDAKFTRFGIKINDKEYRGHITTNDSMEIYAVIKFFRKIQHGIFGYAFNDKYGNTIFANNTSTVYKQLYEVAKDNTYLIKFKIIWPEIKEGEYFLTIGFGEGLYAQKHLIQCWAYNIFVVKNIVPNKELHGIFNNNIEEFIIQEYNREV